MCQRLGVDTEPGVFPALSCEEQQPHVWIVPLFSWYSTPEQDAEDSLYVQPKSWTEDPQLQKGWMDNILCKWDDLKDVTPAKHFSQLNKAAVSRTYDGPVISFSHFLPRDETLRNSPYEEIEMNKEREKLGLPPITAQTLPKVKFNFSRYAGSKTLEKQIRQLSSVVHVHGHQHRCRDQELDGTRYMSHCLGYERERTNGLIWGLDDKHGPKQVWPPLPALAEDS